MKRNRIGFFALILVLNLSGLALMVHGADRYKSRIDHDRREDAAYQAFVDAVGERMLGKVTGTGLEFLDLVEDNRDGRIPQVVCHVRQAAIAELLAPREGAADDAARALHRMDSALDRLSTAPARGLLADITRGQVSEPAAVRAWLDPRDCKAAAGYQA